MAAIGRYMTEIGAGYTPGEYCIPYCLIAGTEEENPEDIRVWGDFHVENYNQAGDRFDAFMALYSNDDAKKAARAKSILDYAEAHGLAISCYQDFGWPAVSIK